MGKAWIVLGDGFEEVEALTVVDVMRRAGIDAGMLSVMGRKEVNGAHNILVQADALIEDGINIEETDMIVLPGGMGGRNNMAASKPLADLLSSLKEKGKRIAAICAAPTVLGRLGLLQGVKALCYPDPSLEAELTGRIVPEANVRTVTDGIFTTSMGPATAMEFALELVTLLKGKDVSGNVASGMLYK